MSMINSEFLRKALSSMCLRPEYYSGRGATTSDLRDEHLEKVYAAIHVNVGEVASKAFVQMVADIPVLSATDFLLTLERFEASGFVGGKHMLGSENGVYVTDMGTAIGTLMSGSARDQTRIIRDGFLRRHGIKVPGSIYGRFGHDRG